MPKSDQIQEAVLVVNTQSRRGQSLYAQAKEELSRQGIRLEAAYPVRDAARIGAIVDEAIAGGHRFIIVGGGDGTISSVVSSFANKDILLGLLPMGTANNFARANDIPLEIAAASAVIAEGRVAQVDLGQMNDTYFTNAVSIGLTSAIHRGSPDAIKRYLGRAGYFLIAARRFASHRSFQCRLVMDIGTIEIEALDLRIANGPFQGGLRTVDEASVNSGDLVVRVTKGPSKWALGRAWGSALLGRQADPNWVQSFRTQQIEIATQPPQYVSVDGEVVTQTPVRISAAPGALQLVTPHGKPSSKR